MTETEEIQKRFETGYTMAVYGNREAIHEQMLEDIESLLILNEALSITAVSHRRELLIAFSDWLQYNGKWDTAEKQADDFLKDNSNL